MSNENLICTDICFEVCVNMNIDSVRRCTPGYEHGLPGLGDVGRKNIGFLNTPNNISFTQLTLVTLVIFEEECDKKIFNQSISDIHFYFYFKRGRHPESYRCGCICAVFTGWTLNGAPSSLLRITFVVNS